MSATGRVESIVARHASSVDPIGEPAKVGHQLGTSENGRTPEGCGRLVSLCLSESY